MVCCTRAWFPLPPLCLLARQHQWCSDTECTGRFLLFQVGRCGIVRRCGPRPSRRATTPIPSLRDQSISSCLNLCSQTIRFHALERTSSLLRPHFLHIGCPLDGMPSNRPSLSYFICCSFSSRGMYQVWNHPVKVSHESFRRAADTNVWPVPYQPLSVQASTRRPVCLARTAALYGTAELSGG